MTWQLTILVRQLATLPSSEDPHCTDLHCQSRVSISCLMNWIFERAPWNTVLRYDYITYPVWYLAQKPWRTKRVQRSIHSKWEVNLSFFCSLSLFRFFNCYFVFLGTFKEEGCRINKSIIAGARRWGGCVSLHCWADSSQQVQSFLTVYRFHRLSIRDLRRYNLNTLEKVCMFFQMSRCSVLHFHYWVWV